MWDYRRFINRKIDDEMNDHEKLNDWSPKRKERLRNEILEVIHKDHLTEREVITHNTLYPCNTYEGFIAIAKEAEGLDLSYDNARQLARRTKNKVIDQFKIILYDMKL